MLSLQGPTGAVRMGKARRADTRRNRPVDFRASAEPSISTASCAAWAAPRQTTKSCDCGAARARRIPCALFASCRSAPSDLPRQSSWGSLTVTTGAGSTVQGIHGTGTGLTAGIPDVEWMIEGQSLHALMDQVKAHERAQPVPASNAKADPHHTQGTRGGRVPGAVPANQDARSRPRRLTAPTRYVRQKQNAAQTV